MSEFVLTAAQRRRLEAQLTGTRDARLYRRTLAVLEVARGRPVAHVAAELGVTRQSVHHWLDAYRRAGDPRALADADRPGRPALGGAGLGRLLRAALAEAPDCLGYPAANWTVPLLREYLGREEGLPVSDATLRRRLHGLGYVWKRYRYVLPPDPQAEKKTPHPPAGAAAGAARGAAVRGRDRPAALAAAAGRVGAAGRAGAGPGVRG